MQAKEKQILITTESHEMLILRARERRPFACPSCGQLIDAAYFEECEYDEASDFAESERALLT